MRPPSKAPFGVCQASISLLYIAAKICTFYSRVGDNIPLGLASRRLTNPQAPLKLYCSHLVFGKDSFVVSSKKPRSTITPIARENGKKKWHSSAKANFRAPDLSVFSVLHSTRSTQASCSVLRGTEKTDKSGALKLLCPAFCAGSSKCKKD
eukprot:g73815.t1